MRFDDSEDSQEDQIIAGPRSSEYPVSRGRSEVINVDRPRRKQETEKIFQEHGYLIGPDGIFVVPAHTGEQIDDRIRSRRRSRERGRRLPSPYYDTDRETERRLERLRELEEEADGERQQLEIEHELQRRAEHEVAEKAREGEDLGLNETERENYGANERDKEQGEKEAKEVAEKEWRERMTKTLQSNEYSEEENEKILEKENRPDTESGPANVSIPTRPTYMKVHTKHLDTETLDIYNLPWEWDDVSIPFAAVTY